MSRVFSALTLAHSISVGCGYAFFLRLCQDEKSLSPSARSFHQSVFAPDE
jgi:hypothetical protein